MEIKKELLSLSSDPLQNSSRSERYWIWPLQPATSVSDWGPKLYSSRAHFRSSVLCWSPQSVVSLLVRLAFCTPSRLGLWNLFVLLGWERWTSQALACCLWVFWFLPPWVELFYLMVGTVWAYIAHQCNINNIIISDQPAATFYSYPIGIYLLCYYIPSFIISC